MATTSDSFTYRIDDGAGGSDTATVALTVTPGNVLLRVDSLETIPSGFLVHFNRPIDPDVLNLYDTQASLYGPPDVTIVGQTVGPVSGSLICHEEGTTVSFVKTGGPLEPDTYTVTLRSAANAFRDSERRLLDGDADNVEGGPYVAVITIEPATACFLSLPDFTRGPGQEVNVPATGSGIPVTISDGNGVLAVNFDFVYGPALLTTTGVSLSSDVPNDWTLAYSLSTPGTVSVMISGPTPLPDGELSLVEIHATIPEDAPYGSARILGLSDIQINQGVMTAQSDCGVQVVAYVGDATGNQRYSSLDAAWIALVGVRLDSGCAAYPMKDPVLIGDVTGNGSVSGLDAAYVASKVVGFSVPQIPDMPAGLPPLVAGGPDPLLSIPLGLSAPPGGTLTVPVSLDLSDLGPMDLLLAGDIELEYDTDVFDVANADVRLGALLSGWSLVANVDDTTGLARLGFYNITPPSGISGTALEIDLHVRLEAPPGTTTLDLLDSSSLMEGQLTLTLEDGEVTVTGVNNAPVAADDNYATVEDAALVVDVAQGVLSNDGDADPADIVSVELALVTQPAHGVVAVKADGSFIYTPDQDYFGTDGFAYQAIDSQHALSNIATVTIVVSEDNDAPVLGSVGNQTVDEGSTLTFTVTASDVDTPVQALTFNLDAGSPAGANTTAGGVFTWTPTEGQGPSNYTFAVVVSDGSLTDSEMITVMVNEINTAPVLAATGSKSIDEGQLLTFTASATDSDIPANALTFSLLNAPAGASIDPASGVFNWTPPERQGPVSYNLTVRVTDNGSPNLYDEEAITIAVLHIPGSPVYRFWAPDTSQHFYTISAAERDKLINNYSHAWTYEGVAYYAFTDSRQPDVAPIYRFWSGTLNAHFYTMNVAERDKLINSYSYVWTYEGVAFYAYAEGFQPVGTRAVYRFWSSTLNRHFFTISQTERDKLIAFYSSAWAYEGIGWYAYGQEVL